MKEGIGGAWLLQLVIFFILLFSGYLALSMNMSRAHRVKSEIVDIIERQKGLTPRTIEDIGTFIRSAGYATTGLCPNVTDGETGWYGLRDNNTLESNPAGRTYVCIKPINLTPTAYSFAGELPTSVYYRVKVFYHLDLPILGDLFRMNIVSESTRIYYPVGITE